MVLTVLLIRKLGGLLAHSQKGYHSSSGGITLNGGSRPIALQDILTEKEIETYITKSKELNDKVNFGGNITTFNIDFSTNSKGQSLGSLNFELKQSGNYVSGSYESLPVPKDFLGTGKKTCFVAAALIEMMLQLTNKIYIKADTGTGRGLVGSNFSELTADNNSISDHAFGRGLDIMQIGNTPDDSIDLVSSLDNFRKGLNIFLTNLQTLSKELHPDLIIIHDQLAEEFGILESGIEGANAAIRTKYPLLAPFINFATDSSHRNHIHVSWSAQRAGSFITPEIAAQLTGSTSTGDSSVPPTISLDKFKISYFDNPGATFSADEVMYLLSTSGIFSDEVAAIFVGIGERESNWRPGALNENKTGSGDFSFGAFQCNLLPGAHGKKMFPLKYSATGQLYEATVLGVKLAYAIDDDNNVESLSKKVVEKATRSTIDKRIFIPYNQAWMLGTVAAGQTEVAKALKGKPIDSYVFTAWGDYNNRDGTPRSTVGFIFKVKFTTVANSYKLKGKSEDSLKAWIRKNFKNKRPYSYIEKWMSGTVFKDDGTEI